MPKTVRTPPEVMTPGMNKKITSMTQSSAPPAKAAPMRADAKTFKKAPEIQPFRFKKNARGHGGENA
jgi:hypothetical protein